MSKEDDDIRDVMADWLWRMAGLLLMMLALVSLGVVCKAQEPTPATQDFATAPEPTPAVKQPGPAILDFANVLDSSIMELDRRARRAEENAETAQSVADNAKRLAKEAVQKVKENNESLLEAGINADLKRHVGELEGVIKAQNSVIASMIDTAWSRRPPIPNSLDFTHGTQLKQFAPKGYIVYHVQANGYGTGQVLDAIARTPPDSVLMIDCEDWLPAGPWYGDASDAETSKYLKRYAKCLIRDVTLAAKAKCITLAFYEVPTVLWKNWNHVRRDNEANYQKWLANQERVLKLAEQSDFLPALRDAGGFVYVQAYTPDEWLKTKFAPQWLGAVITNMGEVLTKRDVPHRFLFRLAGGNEQLYRVMAEKAKGKCDVWEDRSLPEQASQFGKLLGEAK